MRINEVIKELKKGSKIRHSSWPKDDYIQSVGVGCVGYCRLESRPILITPEILLYQDFESNANPDVLIDFAEALEGMTNGEKVFCHSINEEEEYIEMDIISKTLVIKKHILYEFFIDHKILFSTEWMIVP